MGEEYQGRFLEEVKSNLRCEEVIRVSQAKRKRRGIPGGRTYIFRV